MGVVAGEFVERLLDCFPGVAVDVVGDGDDVGACDLFDGVVLSALGVFGGDVAEGVDGGSGVGGDVDDHEEPPSDRPDDEAEPGDDYCGGDALPEQGSLSVAEDLEVEVAGLVAISVDHGIPSVRRRGFGGLFGVS